MSLRTCLILKLDDHTNRTKDFLLHDLHVRLDVREDGWVDEVTFRAEAIATSVDSGAFLSTRIDITHDTVVLDLRHLRSLIGVSTEGVSDLDGTSFLGELLQELVVDSGLDEDTRTSAACLAVVPAKPLSVSARTESDRKEQTYKIPWAAQLTACSRLASSKMMLGLFPPSSRVTVFKFDLAADSMILRPTRVLPVNATLSIFMCDEMAAPTVCP